MMAVHRDAAVRRPRGPQRRKPAPVQVTQIDAAALAVAFAIRDSGSYTKVECNRDGIIWVR